jgi:hypothetical protein
MAAGRDNVSGNRRKLLSRSEREALPGLMMRRESLERDRKFSLSPYSDVKHQGFAIDRWSKAAIVFLVVDIVLLFPR